MRINLLICFFTAAVLLLQGCDKNMVGDNKTIVSSSPEAKPGSTSTELLVSLATEQVGEMAGKSTQDGGLADLAGYSGSAFQKWGITNVGNGYYTITNQGSGKLLQSYNYQSAQALIQNAPDNQADQLWQVAISNQAAYAIYKIINKASGLALTAPPGAAGVITLAPYTGATSQIWTYNISYVAIGPAAPPAWTAGQPLINATYVFTTPASAVKCMQAASAASGAGIQQAAYAAGWGQQWEVAATGTGYYKIVTRATGLALTVPGGAATQGLQLTQTTFYGGWNQLWTITYINYGEYSMINKASGMALTWGAGMPVTQTKFTSAATQYWFFNMVPNPVTVGAIRWDGWCAPLSSVGNEVERDLSPPQFHYRTPFFSTVINADSVQCRGTTQAIMDQEIAYAKGAHLDYWAFCWYPNGSGLDESRQLYLSSTHKNDINWCVILGTNPFNFTTDGAWLVQQFKTSNYQKMPGGGPLVYVFDDGEVTSANMQQLRTENAAAGNPPMYVVPLDQDAGAAVNLANTVGGSATSSYVTWAYNNGGPYAPLVPTSDVSNWNAHYNTGIPTIPWVTSGRNTLPRILNPVSWTTVPSNQWTQDATPTDLANHMRETIAWVKAYPENTATCNSVLIYAWNEFDEGGWICPTLGNNTVRLDTVAEVLLNK
jgi:hypothetical protein